MKVEGKTVYACTERLGTTPVTVGPLTNKRLLRDLVTDIVPPKEKLSLLLGQDQGLVWELLKNVGDGRAVARLEANADKHVVLVVPEFALELAGQSKMLGRDLLAPNFQLGLADILDFEFLYVAGDRGQGLAAV